MDEIFPHKEGVNYSELKLTPEGNYSVTRKYDSSRIVNIMESVAGTLRTKTITDATGCVGGDTIQFGMSFQYVNTIEINSENFEVLNHNISLFGLQNVTLYLGDATDIFNWRTDILYIDPPWGGPDYKQQKSIDVFMSSKRLDTWLEEILIRRNRPNYIFVKLPQNYNFARFNFLSNVNYIKPYRIRGYILVCIHVHMPTSK
jgi:predicted RNA methylase